MEKELSTIGIVGSGKMGLNLFYYLVDFDFQLILVCETVQQKDEVIIGFSKKLNRELKNKLITEELFQRKLLNACITVELELLDKCHLIIEAVTEDKIIKQQLFSKLLTIVPSECILASNSSSILAYDLGLGGTLIGMHFFYPVSLKNIVELMVCERTNPGITEKAIRFLKTINLKHILLNQEGAFMLNRLFLDFQNEAFRLKVIHNLSYREMDDIVTKYFFPVGVFGFFDSVGLDVMLVSIKNYSVFSSGPQQYRELIEELAVLTSQGFLGQKTKRGFYSYGTQLFIHAEHVTIDPVIEKQIYLRLRDCYIQTATTFVEKRICDKATINYAVKEYMGIEKGPFETD
ncbi:MAG: 3-hydroxyacyl-CoA dehydrogenase family protein [Bacteroidota bacterium]